MKEGHDLILFAGGAWELLGCAKCGAQAQYNGNKQMAEKCLNSFSSDSKRKQWMQLVETGRYHLNGAMVGEGIPIEIAVRQAKARLEMQGDFLDDSEQEEAAQG